MNVLAVQRGTLDIAYVRKWCDVHGSRPMFEELFGAVESKLRE